MLNKIQQIPGLTPLRGIAALLVMLMHYQLFVAPLVPAGATHLFDKLYLMVDLFFVLSGFIMYHVYGAGFSQGLTKTVFFTFMRARFARVYPLHLVTLFYLVLLAVGTRSVGITLDGFIGFLTNYAAIPYQLLMLQGVGPYHEALWNSPSWSISTEWWAYVLFPFLMILLSRIGNWLRLVLLVAITASYLWIMFDLQPAFWAQRWADMGLPDSVPYPTGIIDVITGAAVLRCMCGFILGILVYELYVKQSFKQILQSSWVFILTWLGLLVGWHFEVIYDPIAVLLFAVVIMSLAFNSGRLGVFMSGRIFQFLGDISYSLYLVHMPIIMTFIVYRKAVYYPDTQESAMGVGYTFTLAQSWLGLLVFLVIAIGLSALSYRYIEKPARRYLNKRAGA